MSVTGMTKQKAEQLRNYDNITESCEFKQTRRSIGKAAISCIYIPDEDGILQFRPYLAISKVEDNAKAIVNKYHKLKKQFKISASAQLTYIKAKFGEDSEIDSQQVSIYTFLYNIKPQDKETRINEQVSTVLRKLIEQAENIKLRGLTNFI